MPDAYDGPSARLPLRLCDGETPQTVRKFRTTNVKTVTKIIEILRKIIETPWAAYLRVSQKTERSKQTHAVRYSDRRPF